MNARGATLDFKNSCLLKDIKQPSNNNYLTCSFNETKAINLQHQYLPEVWNQNSFTVRHQMYQRAEQNLISCLLARFIRLCASLASDSLLQVLGQGRLCAYSQYLTFTFKSHHPEILNKRRQKTLITTIKAVTNWNIGTLKFDEHCEIKCRSYNWPAASTSKIILEHSMRCNITSLDNVATHT